VKSSLYDDVGAVFVKGEAEAWASLRPEDERVIACDTSVALMRQCLWGVARYLSGSWDVKDGFLKEVSDDLRIWGSAEEG